jgi:hypothetical protein
VVGVDGGVADVDLDPVDLTRELVGTGQSSATRAPSSLPTSQVSSNEKIIAAVAATAPSPTCSPSRYSITVPPLPSGR